MFCFSHFHYFQGIINALAEAGYATGGREGELLALFSQLESPVQSEHPTLLYPQVLEKVLEKMVAEKAPEKGIATQETFAKFGASIGDWPAFPDSAESLQYLQKHFKLVILSNVDRDSFSKSEVKLGVTFDMIVTAQDVGSYKPAHGHFNRALKQIAETWGYKKKHVMHTFQSLYHDAVPANELEIATCHIDRLPLAAEGGATPVPQNPPHLDFTYKSLEEFVNHLKEIERLKVQLAEDGSK
jgi:HAD superfamily hydrolase (TIGR01493 family)